MRGQYARAPGGPGRDAACTGRRGGAAAGGEYRAARRRRSSTSARRCRRTCARDLPQAGQGRDAKALQERLDPRVLLAVHINPEARVRVTRGPAPAVLQQAGYTPVIVKVVNESGGTPRLRIGSPQAGPVYAGMTPLSGQRMQQQHLRVNENVDRRTDRFLDVEMFTAAPMTREPSGLEVEYAIALIYSSEAGPARSDDRRSTSGRGPRTSGSAPRRRCCSTSGPRSP